MRLLSAHGQVDMAVDMPQPAGGEREAGSGKVWRIPAAIFGITYTASKADEVVSIDTQETAIEGKYWTGG